jgi:hypothetical protein
LRPKPEDERPGNNAGTEANGGPIQYCENGCHDIRF